MNRIQSILRGAASVFNFNFNINGNYAPPQFFDLEDLPLLRSTGEAIASCWQTTGDYMRMGMEHVQKEESNGNGKESQR